MRRWAVLALFLSPWPLAVLILLLGACAGEPSALPYYRTAELTPEWLGARTARSASMHRVGAFAMLDQAGSTVTQANLGGHITVVSFFFTHCQDVCPITMRNLQQVLSEMGSEPKLQILSYSILPDTDALAGLRTFAAEHTIDDPRWHLLTGSSDEVRSLARDSYFVGSGDGETYGVQKIAHTESVVLVDGEGRIRGVYAGTLPLEMDRLKEDVRVLMAESKGADGA
jgi:protein SCO1/2